MAYQVYGMDCFLFRKSNSTKCIYTLVHGHAQTSFLAIIIVRDRAETKPTYPRFRRSFNEYKLGLGNGGPSNEPLL